MVAQHALQGTARPAHYIVVYDEIFAPMKKQGINVSDQVQQIVLATHFSMGRATKSVSYCAPAYYADLLAERGRKYLNHHFAPSGSTSDFSGGRGRAKNAEELAAQRARLATMAKDVKLHDRVKDLMVYI